MHHRIGHVLDSQWLWITARVLLALAFLSSGLAGILDARGGPESLRAGGASPGWLLHMAASAIQVGGAVLLMLGHWLWLGTAALAILLLASAFVLHPFWKFEQPLALLPMPWAWQDISLVGGLVAAAIADRSRQRLQTALELYAGVSPRR